MARDDRHRVRGHHRDGRRARGVRLPRRRKAGRRQAMTDRLVLLLLVGCLAFGSMIFVELQLTGTEDPAVAEAAARPDELSFLTLSPQIAFRAGSCVRACRSAVCADGVGQRTVRPRFGRQINCPVVQYRAVSIADRSGTQSRSRDRGSCPLRPC